MKVMNSKAAIATNSRDSVEVLRLGKRPYQEVWQLQKLLLEALISGRGRETLITCEHDPVITLGRRGTQADILVSQEQLQTQNIEVLEVERGGAATFHGPGQLVCYPIINLAKRKRDVNWFVHSLEEVVIAVLDEIGLKGCRFQHYPGVWINYNNGPPSLDSTAKIASVGLRISRWCTWHGLSLNIHNCQAGFALIRPCANEKQQTTSIEEEFCKAPSLSEISFEIVQELLVSRFFKMFF